MAQTSTAANAKRGLVLLADKSGYIEFRTGNTYSLDMKPTGRLEHHGPGAQDPYPEDGDHLLTLHVAGVDANRRANGYGRTATLKDSGKGDGSVLVQMDLAVGDVHKASTMSNFAGGYRLADGVADMISPVIYVPKNSDYYPIWNSANAFQRVSAVQGTPGAEPNLINPGLSFTQFTAPEYALAGFLPTEIEVNADAPLRPFQALADMVLDKLRLEREFRVQTLLTTSGNWNTNNVIALATGAQWNGGAASDPIKNMQDTEEHSFAPVSKWTMGEPAYHALVRSPAVRGYYAFKDGDDTVVPSPAEVSRLFNLAPIYIANMKYAPASGAATYVWPSVAGSSSAAVAIHEPKTMPPTDGRDVMTSATFRWQGGLAPDGTLTAGGFLLRSFFKPNSGGRGGRIIVMAHNDDEVMPSNIIGGLITGIIQ